LPTGSINTNYCDEGGFLFHSNFPHHHLQILDWLLWPKMVYNHLEITHPA
jgi:hypothetical protein